MVERKLPSRKKTARNAGLVQALTRLSQSVSAGRNGGSIGRDFRELLARHFPGVHIALIMPQETAGVATVEFGSGLLRKVEGKQFQINQIERTFGRPRPGDAPKLIRDLSSISPYRPLTPDAKALCIMAVAGHSSRLGYLWAEFSNDSWKDTERTGVLQLAATQFAAIQKLQRLGTERDRLNARLNGIIHNTNAAIVIVDGQRRVKMMNPVAEKLTGYRESEVLDTDAFDIVVVDARYTRWSRIIHEVSKGSAVPPEEVDILAKDGSVRRWLVNAAPIPAAETRKKDIVLVAIDITEKADLERRMIQSEKLVTLGEMAAGIVHELNNPLTVLSGATDMLLKLVDSVGGAELVARPARFARESLDRIQQLARNLMNYARPGGDEDRELVDVNRAIEAALSFSEYELSREGVKIEPNLGNRLPPVRGSGSELQQIIINLLQNARQAMQSQPGSRRIRVETGMEGNQVRITVSDSGPGVPEKLQQRIFEPFFTSRRKSGGSGLGLYIVKNIATRHGGEVRLETQSPIGGAAFSVLLPAEAKD
ncbi:MAG: PAS domain S-box protein [Deltaproteobacteria bacterium]|nr:PAS domain S-box protein [Deltaproteobacteria bacterium]